MYRHGSECINAGISLCVCLCVFSPYTSIDILFPFKYSICDLLEYGDCDWSVLEKFVQFKFEFRLFEVILCLRCFFFFIRFHIFFRINREQYFCWMKYENLLGISVRSSVLNRFNWSFTLEQLRDEQRPSFPLCNLWRYIFAQPGSVSMMAARNYTASADQGGRAGMLLRYAPAELCNERITLYNIHVETRFPGINADDKNIALNNCYSMWVW